MKYLCPYCGRTSDLTHATCDGCGAPTSIASLRGEITAEYLAVIGSMGYQLSIADIEAMDDLMGLDRRTAECYPQIAQMTTLPFPKGNKE